MANSTTNLSAGGCRHILSEQVKGHILFIQVQWWQSLVLVEVEVKATDSFSFRYFKNDASNRKLLL